VLAADALHPRDALLGQPVGGEVRGDRLRARDLEQARHVAEDAAGHPHRDLAVVADQLVVDVDQAAGVDHVVRSVEDSPIVQLLAVAVLLELVVGGAGHDPAAELGDGLVVDHRPQGAGGHDIALDLQDLVDRHDLDAELLAGSRVRLGIDIGAEHLGPLVAQEPRQVEADAAQPLDGDRLPLERVVAEVLNGGLDSLQGAEGRHRRGVAAAAGLGRQAGDPAGLVVDGLHVLGAGADVLGRDVEPVERVDVAAEGPEQLLGLVLLGVADDHGLAAAEVEAGRRRFVGHAAREAEDVEHGLLGAGVGPHPAAAEARTEDGRMNRDDRLEADLRVGAEEHPLVTHLHHLLEEIHRNQSLSVGEEPWRGVRIR
jgi:hypothetical protein